MAQISETRRLLDAQEAELCALHMAMKRDFGRIGKIMMEIRDSCSWAAVAKTWEEYCETRFGVSVRRVQQIIAASRKETALRPIMRNVRLTPIDRINASDGRLGCESEAAFNKATQLDNGFVNVENDPELASFPGHVVEEPEEEEKWHKLDLERERKTDESAQENVVDPKMVTPYRTKDDPRQAAIATSAGRFQTLLTMIDQMKKHVRKLADDPYGWYLNVENTLQDIELSLANARGKVKFATPFGLCPWCAGRMCKFCAHDGGDSGWVSLGLQRQYEKAHRTESAPKIPF